MSDREEPDGEIVLRPAILLDVTHVLPALLRMRGATPQGEGRHRFVALRLADVTRRFAPSEALKMLDVLPEGPKPSVPHLHPEAIRVSCWLEDQRVDVASLSVPDLPTSGGVQALALARIATSRGRLEEAERHLRAAIAAAAATPDPLAVELEVEALGYLARLLIQQRVGADAELARIEELCARHRAGFTQTLFRLLGRADRAEVIERTAAGFAAIGRRMLEGRYTRDVEVDRERVAPLPLHVHGAARAHREDPAAYVEAVAQMAALAWRVGDRFSGYETAYYGWRVGDRLFGAAAGVPLGQLIEELLAPLEQGEREALESELSRKAAGTPK